MKHICLSLSLVFCALNAHAADSVNLGRVQQTVVLPAKTDLKLMSDGLVRPRLMAFSASGDLVIGSAAGLVYRLAPPYTRPETLVDFKGYPHSVAFRKTSAGEELWLADSDGLYRTLYLSGKKYKRDDFERMASLPNGGGHSSRTVKVGPDKRVYVSLGISGNCSDEYLSRTYPAAKRRGGLFVWDETSKSLLPYASGLRNPVGFDWQPQTQKLYASNNGPDHLGFDKPLEIFTPLSEGSFHGMPWYQLIDGRITRDSCVGGAAPRAADDIPKPAAFFPARSAPLDVAFAGSKDLGGRWSGQAFVALHGSWGTPPAGSSNGDVAGRRQPKIVQVAFEGGRPTGQVLDVISGFQLKDGSRWARPAGLAFGPDGALYFTSDAETEGLYRLSVEDVKN